MNGTNTLNISRIPYDDKSCGKSHCGGGGSCSNCGGGHCGSCGGGKCS